MDEMTAREIDRLVDWHQQEAHAVLCDGVSRNRNISLEDEALSSGAHSAFSFGNRIAGMMRCTPAYI